MESQPQKENPVNESGDASADLSQPWKEWLEKDQEMIANNSINEEDLHLIDQTYLLEAAPSQTMG